MHGNTRKLFKKYAKEYFQPNMRVLEVGAALPSALQQIVRDASIRWETVGIDNEFPFTYVGSEYSYPVESGAFDIVVTANVMEHVRKPWVWIKELARVCKPGGHAANRWKTPTYAATFPADLWGISITQKVGELE